MPGGPGVTRRYRIAIDSCGLQYIGFFILHAVPAGKEAPDPIGRRPRTKKFRHEAERPVGESGGRVPPPKDACWGGAPVRGTSARTRLTFRFPIFAA